MERILSKVFISNGDLMKEYTCIWDTGAMETTISNKVISDLNPQKEGGYVFLNTINGEKKSDKYIVIMCIEGHSKSFRLAPSVFGDSKYFDVIIGMDVINFGLFILDKGKFSFTIDQLK